MYRYRLAARRTALVLALGAACGAQAAEGYAPWDSFEGATQIDAQRWTGMERHRMIEGGALRMIQRDLGSQTGDSGYTGFSWSTALANPGSIRQMKGVLTVNGYEVSHCAANASPSSARARMLGTFFNAGPLPTTPGDQTNDVGALVQIRRDSNSLDATNVLRVQGVVYQCTTPDCNYSTLTLGWVDLGTALVGEAVTLRFEWDQANKRFNFYRGSNPVQRLSYAVADNLAPASLSHRVGTRTWAATCTAGRTEAFIDAKFDNIYVNAAP